MKLVVLAGVFALAVQGADLAGMYRLSGVREVGSELLLKPDGKFQYILMYGAADFIADGIWKQDGNAVVLNSTVQNKEPLRLVRSVPGKDGVIRVVVKAPNGSPVPNIDVALQSSTGSVAERTDSQGEALFPETSAPSAVLFRVRVYNFESDAIKVNPSHSRFEFEINGDVIRQVKFENERLVVKGASLEMRFWDPDKAMMYERGR